MFEVLFFLEIIEFYIKFWFVSLALRWLISFLPGKIMDMIRFLGNLVRFPIKRFFYFLYGVKVLETDFEKSLFETEEVKDFDCRITANITGPLLLLSYIGAFLLYFAQQFMDKDLLWIAIIFYVLGFSIILMSAPDIQETEQLLHVSVISIFKWLGKIVLFSLPLYLLIHHYVDNEVLAQVAFIITMLMPVYHHRSETEGVQVVKKNKKDMNILEVDPFGK